MKTLRDQNGNRVTKDIRRDEDGTWSRNVWWGGGLSQYVTNVRRMHGYATRRAAADGDISESAAETNRRHGINPAVLGEFGRFGGREVVEVVLVRGHVREIRRLWAALDDADAPEQDRIFARLRTLGAVREAK